MAMGITSYILGLAANGLKQVMKPPKMHSSLNSKNCVKVCVYQELNS